MLLFDYYFVEVEDPLLALLVIDCCCKGVACVPLPTGFPNKLGQAPGNGTKLPPIVMGGGEFYY